MIKTTPKSDDEMANFGQHDLLSAASESSVTFGLFHPLDDSQPLLLNCPDSKCFITSVWIRRHHHRVRFGDYIPSSSLDNNQITSIYPRGRIPRYIY